LQVSGAQIRQYLIYFPHWWHNSGRTEYYGIIARRIKGKGKKKLIDAGYYAFDLKDFEKWMGK
jgi:hypothetical protein